MFVNTVFRKKRRIDDLNTKFESETPCFACRDRKRRSSEAFTVQIVRAITDHLGSLQACVHPVSLLYPASEQESCCWRMTLFGMEGRHMWGSSCP